MKCKKIIFLFLFTTLQTSCMFPSYFLPKQKELQQYKQKLQLHGQKGLSHTLQRYRQKLLLLRTKYMIDKIMKHTDPQTNMSLIMTCKKFYSRQELLRHKTYQLLYMPKNMTDEIMKHNDLQTNMSLIQTCKTLYNEYNNNEHRYCLIPNKPLPPTLYTRAMKFFSEKQDLKSVQSLIKNEGTKNNNNRKKLLSFFNLKIKNTLENYIKNPPGNYDKEEEKKLNNSLKGYIKNTLGMYNKEKVESYIKNIRYGDKSLLGCIYDFLAVVSPDAQDKEGNTPLHRSVNQNTTYYLARLLNKGANPDLQNAYGLTPLHSAVQRKNIEALNQLLEHNADSNIRDSSNGETPLHLAITLAFNDSNFAIKAQKSLLKHKQTNPNAQDNKGYTPLHKAALCAGNFGIGPIKTLLDDKRVNPDILNNAGETAYHIAASTSNPAKEILSTRTSFLYKLAPTMAQKFEIIKDWAYNLTQFFNF